MPESTDVQVKTIEEISRAIYSNCRRDCDTDLHKGIYEMFDILNPYAESLIKQAELRGARNTDQHWIFEMNSQSEQSTEEWKKQIQRHMEWFDRELQQQLSELETK